MPCCSDTALRTQMVIKFSVSFGIFLVAMLIACIIVVTVTNETVRADSEKALFDQIISNTNRVMSTTARWLELYLKSADSAFVSIEAVAMADTSRPDGYSNAEEAVYFDYHPADLPQPLAQDSRQVSRVSFEHSTFYVAGAHDYDRVNFSAGLNQTIRNSAHVDPFFQSIYRSNTDYFAGYIGFQDRGLYVQYPGKSTLTTDPNRLYDPRNRGWYSQARASRSTTQYTSPYRDFFSGQWMITLSRSLRTDAGVAAGDLLIKTLTDTIQRINFLPSGKMTLFEITSGFVVADKEFVLRDATSEMRWNELRSPAIPSSVWTKISTESPAGRSEVSDITSNGQKYLLASTAVPSFGSQYVLATTVPHSEITAPMTKIVDDIAAAQGLVIGVLCAVFVVIAIIVLVVIFLTAGCIVEPLTMMNENISQMVNNIGKKDLTEGVVEVSGGVGSEESELNAGFNNMVKVLRESRYDANVDNPFYKGEHHLIVAPMGGDGNRFPPDVPLPTATSTGVFVPGPGERNEPVN